MELQPKRSKAIENDLANFPEEQRWEHFNINDTVNDLMLSEVKTHQLIKITGNYLGLYF